MMLSREYQHHDLEVLNPGNEVEIIVVRPRTEAESETMVPLEELVTLEVPAYFRIEYDDDSLVAQVRDIWLETPLPGEVL
jgi:hypothetical protein